VAFLLDTNVLVDILRKGEGHYAKRLARVPPGERMTSSICVAELLYGTERSSRGAKERSVIEGEMLPSLTVLSYDLPAARSYARLRALLERAGNSLEEADLQIAAIALANDLTLITGNVRHFDRIPGLRVENWLE
jgi:tRNA(fMet)-specific endonuclease VapC